MREGLTKPRYVLILVSCIFLAVILLISFKVVSYGFIPSDDAMRHVAKVISGKDWVDILILRPEITMDSHVGWHKVLEFIHKTIGFDKDGLVVFSVTFLFFLFFLPPIFFLERPEAWLITFLIIVIANFALIFRIFLGRPFIFTMVVVIVLSYLWPHFKKKPIHWPCAIILTILIALATWIHCLWYMFALPVLCFFLAREWRAGVVVSLCTVIGVGVGMIMTGHPIQFFYQTLGLFFRILSEQTLVRQLVGEFKPFNGDVIVVFVVFGMLAWRALRNSWDVKVICTPVFILAVVSWALGFVNVRTWLDWGIPALCVWMALEFEDYLKSSMDCLSMKRVWITLAVACVLFLATTSDYNSRWTSSKSVRYLSSENPEHKNWLPGKGGIIYSNSMYVFYQTFYANPHADWRYMLGFEPAMMPPKDLAIFRNIQLDYYSAKAYEPWVKKMKPEDRMILTGIGRPSIKELEWNLTVVGTWVGRLPRK
ncbi:MAG: hypothetical protein JW914_10225 [Syntrophaceae bacterium]|nr:hypothetical protein [Syntrophaceae bacterium]